MLAGDASAHREPIEVITDRSVVKVKTSDRRGALWQDDAGTWWLLAAGRRKDDGPGDFYREIAKYGDDSSPIAPTETDLSYLRYESAYIAECDADREAQSKVLTALLDAAANPGTVYAAEVFGATVSISVEFDDETTETLSVCFELTSFEQQDRFPVDVLAFVPGHEDVDDWDVLPPLSAGDPLCWYAYVDTAWVAWLATAVELEHLVADHAPPTPSASVADSVSHRASAKVVTLAYVEGVEITALCGVRFAPYRNPERFEECPACAEVLAHLRTHSPGPGT